MGLWDRDYMREHSIFGGLRRQPSRTSQWDPAPARRTATRKKRTVTLTFGFPAKTVTAVLACAIGLAAVPAYHRVHDAWYGPHVKPMQSKLVPARVWVPPAKHGHVKIVHVRVLVPSS